MSDKNRIFLVITLMAVALAGAAVYLFLYPDVKTPEQTAKPPKRALATEGDAGALSEAQVMQTADEIPPLTRADVVSVLGKGDVRAVGKLREALLDSHSAVRAQAAVALGRLGHPMVLPDLVNALKDSVFSVRIRAAYALATMDYVPENDGDKERYNRALDEFQSIVKSKGIMADDGNMHLNVGVLYEINKAYDKALEHYRYALRFLPDLADAQDRTQRLLEEKARYKKLVEIVTPVLEKDVRAQIALGMAYVHRGKTKEGIALLQRAAGAGVRSEIVETGLGDAYRKLGDFERARQHYETALKIGSGFPGAHRGLALLAYTQGYAESGSLHWSKFTSAQNNASGKVQKLMQSP